MYINNAYKKYNYNSFIWAFLLYLPSTALMTSSFYYILAPFSFYYYQKKFSSDTDLQQTFLFFVLSCCLSLIVFFVLKSDLIFFSNFLPLQLSLLASLMCSLLLDRKVAKFLLIFLVLEFFVAYIQYYLGVSTFFSFVGTAHVSFDDSSELLYFHRVYGLGNNSSSLAGNALIALVLLEAYFKDMPISYKLILKGMIFLALIAAFSRSGIIAFVGYHLITLMIALFSRKVIYALTLVLFILLFSLYFIDLNEIINQFTRGRDGVEISGRDFIWSVYFDSILNSLFFGNFGIRNYLYIPVHGYQHAHNSYIMALYILGIIPLFIIIIPLVFKASMNIHNSIVLMPLAIFSMAQYFLFWGASLADIILFAVLYKNLQIRKNCLSP